jgi:hypothetical protein
MVLTYLRVTFGNELTKLTPQLPSTAFSGPINWNREREKTKTKKMIIIIIVHLMIIAFPALPLYVRLNPATPSPQSLWQIVSFLGGLVLGAQNQDPLVKTHPSSTFDYCLFVVHRF